MATLGAPIETVQAATNSDFSDRCPRCDGLAWLPCGGLEPWCGCCGFHVGDPVDDRDRAERIRRGRQLFKKLGPNPSNYPLRWALRAL